MQTTDQAYQPPAVVELGDVQAVTLGQYAEDSQDNNRYFS
ncbi:MULTISPECIES: lasso RiPP family leader peptide-containing protein [unclassified Nonomuraea]